MKSKLIALLILNIFVISSSFSQRKVLVEQFTNSGCPSCASNTPVVANYVNNHLSSVLMLCYHADFPYNDSMYFENSAQSDARIAYYDVIGVPTARVDGNYFEGNLVPTLSTTIPNRADIAPRYSITFSGSELTNSTVTANISFQSIDSLNSGESLTAMVVVSEKNVLKTDYDCCPGTNSETQYPWVVRKMLPNENGTVLENTNLNGVDEVSISWSADNFKQLSEMRLVAFVQNTVTKEIYQAEISTPSIISRIGESEKTEVDLFSIYSNNNENYINLQLNQSPSNAVVKVFDILGNTVISKALNSSNSKISTTQMNSGIYYVKVNAGNKIQTKKIIVNR